MPNLTLTSDSSAITATLVSSVVDMVNHPPHYNGHPKGFEAIDIIEDNTFLNLGNAMKYLWRVSWGSKGRDIEDMNKAIWHIQREITRRIKNGLNK